MPQTRPQTPISHTLFKSVPRHQFSILYPAIRWLWKLTSWSLLPAIFWGLWKYGFPRTQGQKLCMGDTFCIFLIIQISQVKSIFRTQKIVDEKLRSVGFHNNLVASSNIQNWCREAALKTGPYAGGKTRWYFLRLKTSGRCSLNGRFRFGRFGRFFFSVYCRRRVYNK